MRLHGLELITSRDGDGKPTGRLEIKTLPKEGKQVSVMKHIKEIKLAFFGIQVILHKPPTSGQRKAAIYDIFKLRAYIGPHALKTYVDDEILAGWINGLYLPEEVME